MEQARPTTMPVQPVTVGYKPRVALLQDGARLHYALAVALKKAGLLSALYTDWYNDESTLAKALIGTARRLWPGEALRMEERRCPELVGTDVFDSKLSPVLAKAVISTLGWGSPLLPVIWRHQRRRDVARGPLAHSHPGQDVLFAFSHCASQAIIRTSQGRGIRVILDQPIATAGEIAAQAQHNGGRWPSWTKQKIPESLPHWTDEERLRLVLADHITCASGYVRDTMLAEGIPPGKITVIPYPLNLANFPLADRHGRSEPATVGFCGEVGLRKGAPWFLEVAKHCKAEMGDKIRLVMVGGINISSTALTKLREHVEVVGQVPRSEIITWLNKFDIFLFPSTCEGSPGAVMEAMATGLPVVTTPNSGTVVREGIDGFIAPYDQPDILTGRILELAYDAEKRLAMGRAASERAREFSIDFYSHEISKVIYKVIGREP